MGKNGLKVSTMKTEHLQTTGDTYPVRMKRYTETATVNKAVLQISRINDRQRRRSQQRRGEQISKGMVAMERAGWSDIRQESSNENEVNDIP